MKLILPTSILALLIALFLLGAPLHAGTKVGWSVSEVSSVVAVGDRKPVRVTLIAQDYLPATRLETTPGLEDWVIAISPSELPAMAAGDEATIDLVVSAGWVGSNDGTLHVRELDHPRTLAKPLPIVLDGVATLEEALPPEPDPEENASTLLGVDTDGDGLRDDIQRSVALEHREAPAIREAIFQLARAQSLVYDADHYDEALKQLPRARECVHVTYEDAFGLTEEMPSITLVRDIHKMSYDTIERARAYLTYDASLGFVVIRTPKAREACDFNKEDMQ